MNPSNRTIEEKLAIVQQLKSNSNDKTSSKKYVSNVADGLPTEDTGHFFAPLVIRLVICIAIFGITVYAENKNPQFGNYLDKIITTQENGNLIDFMSPFTYTLQETI